MKNNRMPAVLGGPVAFKELIPIARPTLPKLEVLKDKFTEILSNGVITNAKYVKEFEEKAARYLGVSYVVAVSSGMSGLLLLIKCLGLKGEVILPSFTFTASAHSLVWNNIKPVFADIKKDTFNIDAEKIEEKITAETSGVMAVHIFGNPCDIEELENICKKKNLKLIFDSAHAFGSKYKNVFVGRFGSAEVFSLSPTKTITTGEGGLISTNNKKLAEKLRLARNYGVEPAYDSLMFGINARLSEFNAILGIATLDLAEEVINKRNALVNRYKKGLQNLPGIIFQKVQKDSRCTYKDFDIVIDADKFGLTRDELEKALHAENISTKKYYSPAVHKQSAYSEIAANNGCRLPITEWLSANVLTLPLFTYLKFEDVDRICQTIENIHEYREKIREVFKKNGN